MSDDRKKCRVVQRTFPVAYNYDMLVTDMTDYIENMYNNPDIKVITMNTVYQRSQFDENGYYRVIFVITDR